MIDTFSILFSSLFVLVVAVRAVLADAAEHASVAAKRQDVASVSAPPVPGGDS